MAAYFNMYTFNLIPVGLNGHLIPVKTIKFTLKLEYLPSFLYSIWYYLQI